MNLTKEKLRDYLLNDAIKDVHRTAEYISSSAMGTASDGYRNYGRFSLSLDILQDFHLITLKQLITISNLIPDWESIAKYLKRIK